MRGRAPSGWSEAGRVALVGSRRSRKPGGYCHSHGQPIPSAVLLLASASPARQRLQEQAAIPHRVQVSGVHTDAIHHADPAQLVELLAQVKAQAVRDSCTDASITAALGCDSVLAFEGGCTPSTVCLGWLLRGVPPSPTTRVQFALLSPAEIRWPR